MKGRYPRPRPNPPNPPNPPKDDVRAWHRWGVDQSSRLNSIGRLTVREILAKSTKPHIQYKACGMLGISFDDAVQHLKGSNRHD